jgi:hypothetical protein
MPPIAAAVESNSSVPAARSPGQEVRVVDRRRALTALRGAAFRADEVDFDEVDLRGVDFFGVDF